MKERKFNNGRGAIVCSGCFIILAEGNKIEQEHWRKDNNWWCIKCLKEHINLVVVPVLRDGVVVAFEELEEDK